MAAENNIVGEVGLLVKPIDPNAQFNRGVDEIIRKLEKQAQFQVKASGLDDVHQQANLAGQAFQNAAIQAAGLTAAIYGIKAGIEGAIGKFSKLFDQLAQARAGFTSILHSEAAGGALLDDIREFARVSPFVTQELVNYSQQLLGVGLAAGKIIPLLKSTGDIISSVGGDTTNLGRVLFTLTQIKSIGVLKGQDTMQLQNSLIPITKYLSEYLHKTSAEIVKMREAGLLTADIVFNALNEQGEKVKGAMDRATRNIAGARAILSDTITQLFQDQPVLNKIFNDIFESIKKLADKMGEAEFQQAFAAFFDGVNTVYEGLKPLFTALSEIAGSGAITGLQLIGTALGQVGNVLSGIPKGAMEAFARLLLALGTIKAPLLLIRYITSIRTLASAIIPATTNLTRMGIAQEKATAVSVAAMAAYRQETLAIQQRTAALTADQRALLANTFAAQTAAAARPGFLGRNAGKIGTGLAIGGTIAGSYLSSQEGAGAKTAGGALTGAGIGATVGMGAGPYGALIGAAAGFALGGITAFLSQAETKARKHIEELKKLGTEAASAFIEAEGKRFSTGVTGTEFKDFKAEIARVEAEIKDVESKAVVVGGTTRTVRGRTVDIGRVDDEAVAKVAGLQAQLDELKSASAAAFDPLNYGLGVLVSGLAKGTAGFEALTKVTKGGRTATDNLVVAEDALKKYGFTLADLGNPDKLDGMKATIEVFDGLTTAQANATREANKYNESLEAAGKLADAIYGPGIKKIDSDIAAIKAQDDAVKAQYDIGTATKNLDAEAAAQKAKKAAWQKEYNKDSLLGYSKETSQYRANMIAEKEYQELLKLRHKVQNENTLQNRMIAANLNDPANRNIGTRDINKEIADEEKRKQDAIDKAKKEAEDAAKKAADAAEKWAADMKTAGENLAEKLESAANDIAAAADRWVGSIKERTQYEQAVSTTRLIKNTKKQTADLAEMTVGLAALKGRGLTADVLDALGIDNVADLKQVRKLLKSSDADLATLSSSVTERDKKAIDAATQEEDTRTRKNIEEGIVAAATTLGMSKTDAKAAGAGIATQFTFNTTSNADEIAAQILSILTGGAISQ